MVRTVDPYKILEIDFYATDEEIKKAYYRAVKKYHPDKYIGSAMYNISQEKIKQINEAYQSILSIRRGKTSNDNVRLDSGMTVYSKISLLLNDGNIDEAEKQLDAITLKDGKWYYYKGCICSAKGWHQEATRCFKRCCEYSPDNCQYKYAFNRVTSHNVFFSNDIYIDSKRRNSVFKKCSERCCDCFIGDFFL